MATKEAPKSAKISKQDFDVISNRLSIALAKRESLIKSWTASSSRPEIPMKTQAELDAEDAALFHPQPTYLGVGAPVPSQFLASEAERNNKSLRAKFFPTKGLKASKARDAEEKASSAKRAMNEEVSDEEEGRSGLGRAKKLKTQAKVVTPQQPAKAPHSKEPVECDGDPMAIDVQNGESVSKGIETPVPRAAIQIAEEGSNEQVHMRKGPDISGQPELSEPVNSVEVPEAEEISLPPPEDSDIQKELDAKERKKMKKREQKRRAKQRKLQHEQPK